MRHTRNFSMAMILILVVFLTGFDFPARGADPRLELFLQPERDALARWQEAPRETSRQYDLYRQSLFASKALWEKAIPAAMDELRRLREARIEASRNWFDVQCAAAPQLVTSDGRFCVPGWSPLFVKALGELSKLPAEKESRNRAWNQELEEIRASDKLYPVPGFDVVSAKQITSRLAGFDRVISDAGNEIRDGNFTAHHPEFGRVTAGKISQEIASLQKRLAGKEQQADQGRITAFPFGRTTADEIDREIAGIEKKLSTLRERFAAGEITISRPFPPKGGNRQQIERDLAATVRKIADIRNEVASQDFVAEFPLNKESGRGFDKLIAAKQAKIKEIRTRLESGDYVVVVGGAGVGETSVNGARKILAQQKISDDTRMRCQRVPAYAQTAANVEIRGLEADIEQYERQKKAIPRLAEPLLQALELERHQMENFLAEFKTEEKFLVEPLVREIAWLRNCRPLPGQSGQGTIPAQPPPSTRAKPAPEPVPQPLPTVQDRVTTFRIEAWSQKFRKSWPAEIRIASIDAASGRITGEIDWPSLSTLNAIEGQWQGSRLTFTETAHLKGSSAHLNVTYDLEVKGASLSGTWTEPGKDSGKVTPR
jgi:hypothetical protein